MLLFTRRSACWLVALAIFSATAFAAVKAEEPKLPPPPGTEPGYTGSTTIASGTLAITPAPPPAKKDANKKDVAKKDAAKGPVATKDAAKTDADKKAEKKEEKDSESKPATEKVKKGAFRISLELDGVFEAQNMSELLVRMQEWNGLTVLKAVEHGAVVKQGDLVLALDSEKLDRMITDQEKDMQIAALSVKQAEEALTAMEKSEPLEMDSGRGATTA